MLSRLASFALSALLIPAIATAQPALDHWSERPASLRAVAAGAGLVVTVGDSGAIRTSSDDGVTWTSAASPVTTRLNGVAYGAGAWVAVGEGGVILTSADGVTWSIESVVVLESLNAITFGNGTFVVAGGGGHLLTSADGATWSVQSCMLPGGGACGPLNGVGFGDGRFLAVGANSLILTSTAGAGWTTFVDSANPATLFAATGGVTSAGHTLLLAAGDHARVYLNDLTAGGGWQIATNTGESPRASAFSAATYADGRFVLSSLGDVNGNPLLASSSDPASGWAASFFAGIYNGVAFTGTRFVTAGLVGAIATSIDTSSWTIATWALPLSYTRLAYGNNAYVAAGDCSELLSSDGRDWTLRDAPAFCSYHYSGPIAFGNGRFALAGIGGWATSTDNGATWTTGTMPIADYPQSATFGNGLFMSVGTDDPGENGIALTSPDGVTWTRHLIPGFTIAWSVAFGDGVFIVGGDGGIATSTDGVAWNLLTPPAAGTNWVLGLTYGAGHIVAIADTYNWDQGTFMVSSDGGATWDTQPSGVIAVRSLAFGNGVFAASGAAGLVLSSADFGLSWQSHSLTGTMYDGIGLGSLTFAQNAFIGVTGQLPVLQSAQLPLPSAPLTVVVHGSGRVTSSPAGIDCGTECSAPFDTGTSVVLSAVAAAGGGFTGWSDDCSGTAATVTVLVDAAKTCTAIFSSAPDTQAPTAVLQILNTSGAPASVIPFGQGFTLDGSRSFDVGGSVAQYRWTSLTASVPGLALNVDVVTTTPTLPIAITAANAVPVGRYRFQLVVVDDSGNVSQPATVDVIIADTAAPTAVLQVLNASGAPVSVIPFGQGFTLDGSRSFDVGGSVAQYRWTSLTASVPGLAVGAQVTTTSAALPIAITAANAIAAGRYAFQLIVVDDSGNASLPTQVEVLVLEPAALSAVLKVNGVSSPSVQIPYGQGFMLDGQSSVGAITKYVWTSVSASVPGLPLNTPVTTTTPTLAIAASPLAKGRYDFLLQVLDASGNASSPAMATAVIVDVDAPTAILTINGSSAPEVSIPYGQSIMLGGAGSTDVGGVVAQYRWTSLSASFPGLAANTTVTTTSPTFVIPFDAATSPLAGRYVFQLVAIDDSGNQSALAQATLLISDTIAPSAVLRIVPATAGYGQPFTLDGSASADVGGRIASYVWRSMNADFPGLAKGASVSTTAASLPIAVAAATAVPPGRYNFALTVVDDSGNVSAQSSAALLVVDNVAPTAVLTVGGQGGNVTVKFGTSFTLDGGESTDALGRVARYEWTALTDGVPGMPANAPVTTANAKLKLGNGKATPPVGRHVFSLVAIDDSGNRSQPAAITVIVR